MSTQEASIFAHDTSLEQYIGYMNEAYPDVLPEVTMEEGTAFISLNIKRGLFRSKRQIKMRYERRAKLSATLVSVECKLTQRLITIVNMIAGITPQKRPMQALLVEKMKTINSELAFQVDDDSQKELLDLVSFLANKVDAVVMAHPNTILFNSSIISYLNSKLQLVLDMSGRSDVDQLLVKVNAAYVQKEVPKPAFAMSERKKQTLEILKSRGLRYFEQLYDIQSEEETTLRTPIEISERLVCLWMVMLVAFKQEEPQRLLDWLDTIGIKRLFTPDELAFFENPTDEERSLQTWKCENIWLLMWALKVVDELPFPDTMISLNNIPKEHFPLQENAGPAEFIWNHKECRTKKEILDACDLYYRLNWLCRDNHIKGIQTEGVIPGAVYERYYTLNWLIRFEDSNWDDVDTPS
jgi:hypothetical protein